MANKISRFNSFVARQFQPVFGGDPKDPANALVSPTANFHAALITYILMKPPYTPVGVFLLGGVFKALKNAKHAEKYGLRPALLSEFRAIKAEDTLRENGTEDAVAAKVEGPFAAPVTPEERRVISGAASCLWDRQETSEKREKELVRGIKKDLRKQNIPYHRWVMQSNGRFEEQKDVNKGIHYALASTYLSGLSDNGLAELRGAVVQAVKNFNAPRNNESESGRHANLRQAVRDAVESFARSHISTEEPSREGRTQIQQVADRFQWTVDRVSYTQEGRDSFTSAIEKQRVFYEGAIVSRAA